MSCTELDRRYRIIIPLNRVVNAEEYSAIARSLMLDIKPEFFDPVSALMTQWMFLPANKDEFGTLYMGQCFDGDPMDVDAMLQMIAKNKEHYQNCRIAVSETMQRDIRQIIFFYYSFKPGTE